MIAAPMQALICADFQSSLKKLSMGGKMHVLGRMRWLMQGHRGRVNDSPQIVGSDANVDIIHVPRIQDMHLLWTVDVDCGKECCQVGRCILKIIWNLLGMWLVDRYVTSVMVL